MNDGTERHFKISVTDPNNPKPAVGHLLAGRIVEAEQAYRELATRHSNQPAYVAAARILARRIGPDCRTGNTAARNCPVVKP